MTGFEIVAEVVADIVGDPVHAREFVRDFEKKFPYKRPLDEELSGPEAAKMRNELTSNKELFAGFVMGAYRKFLSEKGLTH